MDSNEAPMDQWLPDQKLSLLQSETETENSSSSSSSTRNSSSSSGGSSGSSSEGAISISSSRNKCNNQDSERDAASVIAMSSNSSSSNSSNNSSSSRCACCDSSGTVGDNEGTGEYRGEMDLAALKMLFCTRSVLLAYAQGIPGCLPWGLIYVFLNDYFR
jgi:hypothetical protein